MVPAVRVRSCVSGHFGEFLQGRLGPSGPVALVTLPCPALAVTAEWRPAPGFVLATPGGSAVEPDRMRRAFRALTGRSPHGRLVLRAGMPPGGGAGASTASLLALAGAVSGGGFATLPPEAQAAFCLALEGATDPLMHAAPASLLWQSRRGRIAARLPEPPAFEVVGGFTPAPQRTDPADEAFADIADLAGAWAPAAAARDRAALASLATESARRNTRLRGGELAPLAALAAALGALGLAVAHTGSARALLFAPGAAPPGSEAALRGLDLGGVLRFSSGSA